MSIRQVVAHPHFNNDEESSVVAVMENDGNVALMEVEMIDDEYNEQMKIGRREPGFNYLDIFGGDKPDDIGQRQSTVI